MSASAWTVYLVETTTGRITAELPFVGVPGFDSKLNDPGSGSVQVALGGSGIDPAFLDQATVPWRFTIAICWGNAILEAGPIVSETYTDGQSTTNLHFVGMRGLFAKRLTVPSTWVSGSTATTAADVTYSAMTLRQIAKRLIQDSISRTGGTLPLTLPADDAAGTNTRSYYGYELNLVHDMLTNLSQNVDGPEISFDPTFSSTPGYITWNVRIGSPRLGQITGSPWVWDYDRRGALTKLDFARDGQTMTFDWLVKGAGNNYGTIIGSNYDSAPLSAGYPLLEGVDTGHTDVTLLATANLYAQADTQTYRYPVQTYTAYVRIDGMSADFRATGAPDLSQFTLGDTAQFVIVGHRRIPDATLTLRIVQITSADLLTVKLGLQATT